MNLQDICNLLDKSLQNLSYHQCLYNSNQLCISHRQKYRKLPRKGQYHLLDTFIRLYLPRCNNHRKDI